ncbi:glycosyltransferase [bacterium]|nr:MAG: glycosyltransferase [bacterium]
MSSSNKLTVLCVFNEPNLIETTLTSIYELRETPFELIIVNDGAGADATSIIQSITEFYNHEETYFFEYDAVAGVGMRVNEVLSTVTGDFLWVANSLGRIDEAELVETLEQLNDSEALVATLLPQIPGSINEWLERLQSCTDLQRLGFIWKWNAIPSNQKFFNPFLMEGVSFELTWRLEQIPYVSRSAWFQPAIEEQEMEVWAIRRELALHWLRTYQLDAELKNQLIQVIDNTGEEAFSKAQSQAESLLDKAREERSKGNLVRALNYCREAFHQEPENEVIRNYYVELLEYLGRFVEASEIRNAKKDNGGKKEVSIEATEEEEIIDDAPRMELMDEIIHQNEYPREEADVNEAPVFETSIQVESEVDDENELRYSIVIPSTGYGLGLLENALESLANVIDRDRTEVIIIDNASLDETYALLEEIEQRKSFRLQVITNRANKGFAASVNQGIEAAQADFVLIMHNDIKVENDILYELSLVFETHPDAGAVAPLLSASLVQEQDKSSLSEAYVDDIVALKQLDSACLMIKKSDGFRFDEQFGLAYFDDVDFCEQLLAAGKKLYLNTQVEVHHDYGMTAGMMGLSPVSDYYALNLARFNKKWGLEPQYEAKYNQLKELDRVLVIASLMNPVDPEMHLFEEFKRQFSDEVKTEIVKTKWDEEYAIAIASMLIKTDQRDVLRKFEEQLDDIQLPVALAQDFVRYYFSKNIFSRCQMYLEKYGEHPQFMDAHMYYLKILLGERLLEQAADMLGPMFEAFPGNPELYKLTGDFHSFQNNHAEAKQFYDIAAQIDPFRFGKPKATVSFI